VSRENVEVVRQVYEAAARRDSAGVLALYDADVMLDDTRLELPDDRSGVYHGHEGLRQFFRGWHEAWDHVEYDYDELIDAGGENVVAVVTRRARGRSSGAEVEMRVALVWAVRAGKVVRVVWFPTRDEALRAAQDT
jgi:ketosteroid isomerase-like protein